MNGLPLFYWNLDVRYLGKMRAERLAGRSGSLFYTAYTRDTNFNLYSIALINTAPISTSDTPPPLCGFDPCQGLRYVRLTMPIARLWANIRWCKLAMAIF